MGNIFVREIGVVIANSKLAKEVFEAGMGLQLIHTNPTSQIYQLNEQTRLNVWTDGKRHPLSQAYLEFFTDKETILQTANILQNWHKGVILKRLEDRNGKSILVLRINLPEGTDISLSDRDWNSDDLEIN